MLPAATSSIPPCTVTDEDLEVLDGCITAFMATAHCEVITRGLGNVTPKLHFVEDHVVVSMRRFRAGSKSSTRVGVHARIQEVAPKATYVHCNGHCLNLVISHSCASPEVYNVLDRPKYCCRTFLQSPKKSALLEKVVSNHFQDHPQRKALLDLCRTRWAEHHIAYQHFHQSYIFIVEALEVIGHHLHLDIYEDRKDWDSDARSEAQQVLLSIASFDFIVVFLPLYFYLSHLSGVTVKLQGKAVDIEAAHSSVLW